MNVVDVMDEIATVLEARIPGLRAPGYPVAAPVPPVAVFGWPEEITFDETYRRGSDKLTLPVLVIAGPLEARSNFLLLGEYLSGSGPKSIKRAIESGTYGMCDSVTVARARTEDVKVSGRDQFAAVFDVDIVGKGA